MQLLIVRHAIAEERVPGASDVDDADRELTPKGARRMRSGADHLRRLVPGIDLVATSPLTRALDTARILSAAYGELHIVPTSTLAPGEPPAAFAEWLSHHQAGDTVAAVGHEPGLSVLVSWLLCGSLRSVVELKKGGVCLLDCPEGPAAGTATLLWSLRPGHLRALGK